MDAAKQHGAAASSPSDACKLEHDRNAIIPKDHDTISNDTEN